MEIYYIRNFDSIRGRISYPSVYAQSSEDNYLLPVVLVYPPVWAEKDTIPPTIEIKVLDLTPEEDLLETAEGDKKEAFDTESSISYFENPKTDVNAGDEIEVCISAIGTNDYPDLSKCQTATVGDDFPTIPVFLIQ